MAGSPGRSHVRVSDQMLRPEDLDFSSERPPNLLRQDGRSIERIGREEDVGLSE